jgi:hypothetical protein
MMCASTSYVSISCRYVSSMLWRESIYVLLWLMHMDFIIALHAVHRRRVAGVTDGEALWWLCPLLVLLPPRRLAASMSCYISRLTDTELLLIFDSVRGQDLGAHQVLPLLRVCKAWQVRLHVARFGSR